MNKDETGGPAFPGPDVYHPNGEIEFGPPGMTLRDNFAAKILPDIYTCAMREAAEGSGLFTNSEWRIGLALDAYKMADAMLLARES